MKKHLLALLALGATLSLLAAPRLQNFTFGEVTVTAIQDTSNAFPAALFPDNPETLKKLRELAPRLEAEGSNNVFLVKLGKKTILVDTGYGKPSSQLVPALDALHISPNQIDAILITHLHADHVGGLLAPRGTAIFPRATIWISRPEAAAAGLVGAGKHPSAHHIKAVQQVYRKRLRYFTDGQEIFPGLVAHLAPGHTPGHATFQLKSDLLFIGDLLHAQVWQFAHPELCPKWDAKPDQAVASRTKIFAEAAKSGIALAGAHLPFPGIVTIKDGNEKAKYLAAPKK